MDWYTPMTPIARPPETTEEVKAELNGQIVAGALTPPTPVSGVWAGDKYHGGFGPTQLLTTDYWTLRKRSDQLFRTNLYARGLIRRLVTNVINVGLTLECIPDEAILGVPEDSLTDWADDVENRFNIWARNPLLCDYEGRRTFGEIQRQVFLEALVSGDVLIMLDQSRTTGLPRVRIVNGGHVQNPINYAPKKGHTLEHGVELDSAKRHVAYHVEQVDGGTKRVRAYGSRSGRRVAWLVYGTDKRLDDVRGEPILSIFLQSLLEIDRYRDAALRKATINSVFAMAVEKSEAKPGTLPATGGAVRKGTAAVEDSTNSVRRFAVADYIPGVIVDELQQGEKMVPHSTAGTDVNFETFEAAIINAIAWACEIPPSIAKLMFSSNYSASQGENNELRMYLGKERTRMSESLLQYIYEDLFLSMILKGKIQANGFLEAWRDPQQYDIYGAWVASEWTGVVKPIVDAWKHAKGLKIAVDEGWATNARASKETYGTDWRKNIKRLKRENELKAEARAPLIPEIPETAEGM